VISDFKVLHEIVILILYKITNIINNYMLILHKLIIFFYLKNSVISFKVLSLGL